MSFSNAIPPRKRRRWGRVLLLFFLAGIGIFGWREFTWRRAIGQLNEAGIRPTAAAREGVWTRVRQALHSNWRLLFDADTWEARKLMLEMDSAKAGQLSNLNSLASALRRVKPWKLDLSGCSSLRNIDGLRSLTSLDWLVLSGCSVLQNLDALTGHTTLTTLDLSDCVALQNVNGLKGVASLEWLCLSNCPQLRNVGGIKGLNELKKLTITESPFLENLDDLKGLASLKSLFLNDCTELRNVDGIKGLATLVNVYLEGCTKLTPQDVGSLEAALPDVNIYEP